jgi:hypothetical protein
MHLIKNRNIKKSYYCINLKIKLIAYALICKYENVGSTGELSTNYWYITTKIQICIQIVWCYWWHVGDVVDEDLRFCYITK